MLPTWDDGAGAGLALLAGPDNLPPAEDPAGIAERSLAALHRASMLPTGETDPHANLRGARVVPLAGDVGPAQIFSTVEDAQTLDTPSAGVSAPYLPGRIPTAANTGEQGNLPT